MPGTASSGPTAARRSITSWPGLPRRWRDCGRRPRTGFGDALAAMDAGTLFGNAGHVSVIKSAIALHFTRSKATQVIHARVWAKTVERGRRRWMTEHRQLLAYWFYREKGLYPAGNEALGIFADELMGLSLSLAGSGALWRERIESLYLQARAMTDAAGLEILTAPASGEFLIGDVPALTVRADRVGVGVLGGIALAEAQSAFLPLGPRHARCSRTGQQDHSPDFRSGRGSQRAAARRRYRLRVPAPGKPFGGHRPLVRGAAGELHPGRRRERVSRGLVRGPHDPESGDHGRIADGGGPESRLEARSRWSARG